MGPASRDLVDLLQDLIKWGDEAASFVAGRNSEWLLADRTAELALTRLIEVSGEIAGRIVRQHGDWFRDRQADDLVSAYRMRNRLAHGYEGIQPDMLFDVADRYLKDLVSQARIWLAEVENDEA